MVYKVDKRRVHSGNTLRASNSRYNRQYRLQSCLVRQSKNVTKTHTVLEELGLDKDNVAYSLNKKGRWLVPQILKHEVITKCEDFGNVKVDLIESHKMKKQAKCIGFHSNKGLLRKVIPKKKTYFNSGSVTGPKKETSVPALTVNIVYPCPVTSSISHNPKYIKCEDISADDFDHNDIENTKELAPVKGKSKKQRRKISTKQRMNDYLDELQYIQDEDYDSEDKDSAEIVSERLNSVSVEDILIHSRKMQQFLFAEVQTPERTQKVHVEPKDRVVYMDRGEEQTETKHFDTPQAYSLPPVTTMEHVSVNIPSALVNKEMLMEAYGKNYVECSCYPRKFLINITKKVQTTTRKSKGFRGKDMHSVDLSAVLVFVYDMFAGLDSTDTDVFKVSLNMKTKQYRLKIDTLCSGSVYSVDDIISRAISYVETIPYEEFVPGQKSYANSRPARTNFEILNENKKLNILSPSNPSCTTVDDLVLEADDGETCQNEEPLVSLNFESLPPETCSICFEFIPESSATALQTCGHWFCDKCWNEHLLSVANGGSGKITCPEYKCTSKVQYNILLTVSNLQLVERVFRRNLTLDIETKPDTKWCPNQTCGRAIRCEKKDVGKNMNVACACGTEVCFDCMKPAHWPLSCDSFTSYLTKLRKNGDEHLYVMTSEEKRITFVQGKSCPSCNRFIEKQGGCFYMSCVCGTHFCWGCNQSYPGHVQTKACNPHLGRTSGDLYMTKKVELRDQEKNTRKRTKSYKRAVEFRSLRRPEKVSVMSSSVHPMSKTLKALNRRHGDRIGAELIDFETPKTKDAPIVDKIQPFLSNMISVYVEVFHLCEFTTVFIDKSENTRSLSKVSKNAVAGIRDRLEGLGGEIFFVFQSKNSKDLPSTISRLWHLRFRCKKAVASLVKALEY